MTYLMIVRVPEDAAPTPVEADPTQWVEQVVAAGQSLAGDRLRPPQDATCVRVRDGRTLVTHGPFAEVVELISGFDLLDVDDEETAVKVALAHPVARFGALELRRLDQHPGLDGTVDESEAWRSEPFSYVLLMGAEPGAPDPDPADLGRPDTWITAAGAADRGGSPLRPAAEAVTVRERDGQALVTHGPFAEVAEQIAGYQLLDVPDLDAAIALAATHPAARHGVVEIRPRWPLR